MVHVIPVLVSFSETFFHIVLFVEHGVIGHLFLVVGRIGVLFLVKGGVRVLFLVKSRVRVLLLVLVGVDFRLVFSALFEEIIVHVGTRLVHNVPDIS